MSSNTTSPLVSTLTAIQFRMSTIVMPILLVFGSGGNILNAVIFLQKTFRTNSCSMYMIAGSLLHTVALCWAMSTTLYSLDHRDPLTYSEPYCKIRQYLIAAILTMARCCIGMACVDRFAVSSRNVKIRAFGRPRVALYVIAIIIVIWLIVSVHLIIVNTIQNGRCVMPGLYPYFYAAYAILVAAIIPPSMMIIFSILAAKNIRQIRQRVQPLPVRQSNITNVNTGTNRNIGVHLKQYDYQLLKMLVIDVIIYCISSIPAPIYYIYAAVTLKSIKSAEQTAWQNFFNYLAYQFLLYIAASTNLYTNLLVSKAFRAEFWSFLNRYIFKRRQQVTNNSTNNTIDHSIALGRFTLRNETKTKLTITQQQVNTRSLQHE